MTEPRLPNHVAHSLTGQALVVHAAHDLTGRGRPLHVLACNGRAMEAMAWNGTVEEVTCKGCLKALADGKAIWIGGIDFTDEAVTVLDEMADRITEALPRLDQETVLEMADAIVMERLQ